MAWNRADTSSQSAARKTASKSPSAVKGAIAGVVVVAVLGLAAFFIFGGKTERPVVDEVEKVKSKVIAESKTKYTPPAEKQTDPQPRQNQTKGLYTYLGKAIVSESAVTNGPVIVTTMVAADGEKYQKVGRVTRQIFDTNIDRRIASVISEEPGRRMAPLPPANPNADAEFLKAIQTPIIITKDDSPEDAAMKRAVIDARLQIKDAMDAGEHFNDILAKHHEWHNANIELSAEANDAYSKLVKEGSLEEAKAYKARANEVLEKAGARPISGPKQKKKTLVQ